VIRIIVRALRIEAVMRRLDRRPSKTGLKPPRRAPVLPARPPILPRSH
jgi:hypothetical protein